MKNYLFKFITCVILFIIPAVSFGQNITAKYLITKNVTFSDGDKKKDISVNLTGNYYRKGNKYIYWEHPDYLTKYPDGNVPINDAGNNYTEYSLNTDTVQMLFYHDYDSLIMRYGRFNKIKRLMNEASFEKDISAPWEISAETKVIQGFKCQHATDRNQWVVWFCPSIPAQVSLHHLYGLPGLVIQASCIPTNESFTLANYDPSAKIDDSIFGRNEMKGPFRKGPLIKSQKFNQEKTKAQKQHELLNQN